MSYVRTLATSAYQGGQKRNAFDANLASKRVKANQEQADALQAKKDAKADAKARLEARQRAHQNRNGFITFKDPSTGEYKSGTPADFAAARRKAQQDAAKARKNFKGHVTEVSPYDGSKQPVTTETAKWWRSQKKVVKNNPNPNPTPAPGPKPLPAPIPKPGPKPVPVPTPPSKPGMFGKFLKKLGKYGIPLLLLGGLGALLLKNCKGCDNKPAPVVTPEKDCKAVAKEDVTKKEIKNIAYKMQAGDRFDRVIEAKYGITDPAQNKKVREYIREQMGLPKSGQDANGKTIIPRIEQDGKTLYDAYFLPEQLPENLGGAKYQDNEVTKSHLQKGATVGQDAKNTTRVEKTSNGYSIITTCKNADGSVDRSVTATGLSKEDAEKIVAEMNK